MTSLTKSYLPALLWLLAVTGLSVMPSVSLPKFDLFSPDKLGHAAAYGILVWLFLYGFKKANGRPANWKEGLFIFIMSVGYGVLMEFVQGAYIPGRFYEIDDMVANAVGAAVIWGWEMWKPRPT